MVPGVKCKFPGPWTTFGGKRRLEFTGSWVKLAVTLELPSEGEFYVLSSLIMLIYRTIDHAQLPILRPRVVGWLDTKYVKHEKKTAAGIYIFSEI